MYRFEHSEYLLILAAIPVLVAIYWYFEFYRQRKMRLFGRLELLSELMPDYSSFRKRLKFALFLLSFLFLVIAIAGPQYGSKLTEVKQSGIEIIFALDVSNSMLARDLSPNRLERAKQELARLVDRLEDDQIGLIVFAGEAYTQIPVTNDYLSAKMFLSGIHTHMISKQGTDIAAAIRLAVRSFSPRSETGKAIVIISDGENHEGGIEEAIDKAKDMGIKVFTVGMGLNQGTRIPMAGSRDFFRDRDGSFVITKLNEGMLMDIASSGGGKYYRASMPNMGLSNMLAQLKGMKKDVAERKVFEEYEEQFPFFIWMALSLLLLELIIQDRRTHFIKDILKVTIKKSKS
jgi:Ca-activated chloride channel family protein